MKYVLDADVVIGALDMADAHHARSRQMLTDWRQSGDTTSISAINLTEVLVAPSLDPERLRAARNAIAALAITVDSPSEAVAVDAGRLRGRHPIGVPDAYALATARSTGGTLASFDSKVLKAAASEDIPTI